MVLGELVKAGATVDVREMFYKEVVQVVRMYLGESWFIMDVMMKVLEGFHHCIARSTAGKT